MKHGSCGQLDRNATRMIDGNSSKKHLKYFQEQMQLTANTYPNYKDRDNGRRVVRCTTAGKCYTLKGYAIFVALLLPSPSF